MNKTVFLILIATLFSCTHVSNNTSKHVISKPKNIIMVIGDGMGPAYISAYRYFKDNPNTETVEQTIFDKYFSGVSSTHPDHTSGYVTDSAAAATALATATKTYNGAIAVDINKNPVKSVLLLAKEQGKKTAIVVTSQINHATPASYLVNNTNRRNYNEIADSYLSSHNNIDLLFGGGWNYFIRSDNNLVDSFKTNNFHYINSYEQLNNLPKNKKILGLFAENGLPWSLDDSHHYRLSLMTKSAVKQVENSNGFFMLIEASQIDWAGHQNDISSAMAEMDDLAKTLEYLETYVANHSDTLVIVTADHSTGGLSIAKDGNYFWQPNILNKMKISASLIAKKLVNENITPSLLTQLFNFQLTKAEITLLKRAKLMALDNISQSKSLTTDQGAQKKSTVEVALYEQIKKIIDDRTGTGWTTTGHTGIDVPVFAFGEQSQLFKGFNDNTDIAKKIFTLLQ